MVRKTQPEGGVQELQEFGSCRIDPLISALWMISGRAARGKLGKRIGVWAYRRGGFVCLKKK